MFEQFRTHQAEETYQGLKAIAFHSLQSRTKNKKTKASPVEGLFKQVQKTLDLLTRDPRHPSLKTHEYDSLPNPYNKKEKVFEAYAQNRTPGAYRIFWCYGPKKGQITILAITPHP
jgi:hypothetical protein